MHVCCKGTSIWITAMWMVHVYLCFSLSLTFKGYNLLYASSNKDTQLRAHKQAEVRGMTPKSSCCWSHGLLDIGTDRALVCARAQFDHGMRPSTVGQLTSCAQSLARYHHESMTPFHSPSSPSWLPFLQCFGSIVNRVQAPRYPSEPAWTTTSAKPASKTTTTGYMPGLERFKGHNTWLHRSRGDVSI